MSKTRMFIPEKVLICNRVAPGCLEYLTLEPYIPGKTEIPKDPKDYVLLDNFGFSMSIVSGKYSPGSRATVQVNIDHPVLQEYPKLNSLGYNQFDMKLEVFLNGLNQWEIVGGKWSEPLGLGFKKRMSPLGIVGYWIYPITPEQIKEERDKEKIKSAVKTTKWIPGHKYLLDQIGVGSSMEFLYLGDFWGRVEMYEPYASRYRYGDTNLRFTPYRDPETPGSDPLELCHMIIQGISGIPEIPRNIQTLFDYLKDFFEREHTKDTEYLLGTIGDFPRAIDMGQVIDIPENLVDIRDRLLPDFIRGEKFVSEKLDAFRALRPNVYSSDKTTSTMTIPAVSGILCNISKSSTGDSWERGSEIWELLREREKLLIENRMKTGFGLDCYSHFRWGSRASSLDSLRVLRDNLSAQLVSDPFKKVEDIKEALGILGNKDKAGYHKFLNDILGFTDAELYEIIKETKSKVINELLKQLNDVEEKTVRAGSDNIVL